MRPRGIVFCSTGLGKTNVARAGRQSESGSTLRLRFHPKRALSCSGKPRRRTRALNLGSEHKLSKNSSTLSPRHHPIALLPGLRLGIAYSPYSLNWPGSARSVITTQAVRRVELGLLQDQLATEEWTAATEVRL